MQTFKKKYFDDVIPKLMEQMNVKNRLRIPRLEKVVVNMGIGIADKDSIKSLAEDLAKITGQKPVLTKAWKSISAFKLREGMIIGIKVTLRREKMYEFLERLINAALPRIRDFRGLSPDSFDSRGNYTFGVSEQAIFPEIDPNNLGITQGMDITIVTTAGNDNEARDLLKLLGVPFSKK
ncbi:50S ribosomal protein L5 [Verrucomicrobiota bacterium]